MANLMVFGVISRYFDKIGEFWIYYGEFDDDQRGDFQTNSSMPSSTE